MQGKIQWHMMIHLVGVAEVLAEVPAVVSITLTLTLTQTLILDSRTNTPGQIPTGQIPTGHIPTGQLPLLQNTPWTYTHHKMKCEEKP